MSDSIVKLNSSKDTEFEFEVTIQGVSPDSPDELAQVRFVISSEKYSLSFPCKRVPETANKWLVKFPVLDMLDKDKAFVFTIEVIVDGYFFEPATGNVAFVTDPQVNLTKPISKPSVKAVFTTKDAEEKKEEEPKKEEPKKDEEKKSDEDEEQVVVVEPVSDTAADLHQKERDNATMIAQLVQQQTQPKDVAPIEISFGVKSEATEEIAQKIIFEQEIAGKPGFLFPKGKDGKKKVQGLMTEQEKEKDKKVKDLLKQVKK